ncbi:hypothetical protein PPO43_10910 [Saprospira sp. CCB-QB6]|uniref:hypothetical protein n=1 Tax=Saprospira sp. CCB-QB6 TaxID=3023936 RepID=UPI00234A5707|nr:hypothetical protein [Saprospira sp. CCB-QB6]WCL80477.1 hypothetical protein PPO43_10910 [Saprospira sp. CCB-QB6]
MKRSILYLALMAFLFTACAGGEDAAKMETTDSSQQADGPKIQTGEFKFINFELAADASLYLFEDRAGEIMQFWGNEASNYQFAQEVPEDQANMDNQGWAGNPELKGKWFKIQYTKKEVVVGNFDMPKEMAEVILSADLIAD